MEPALLLFPSNPVYQSIAVPYLNSIGAAGNSPESFNASFDLQGKKVVLAVTANSVYNPLRLSQMNSFSCPGKS